MKQQTKLIALLAVLPMVLILLSIGVIGEAYAMKSITGTHGTDYLFFKSGALTAPFGDKPFGGDHVVGHYSIKANTHAVKITAEFEVTGSPEFVLEGWLVDVDTGFKRSLGLFTDETNSNRLFFEQEIASPWVYDLFVVTEEPRIDEDPNPNKPVGGTPLSKHFGHNHTAK